MGAGGRHHGRTYDVTGPERLSLQQAAEAFALVKDGRSATPTGPLGRRGRPGVGYGGPDWQVKAWVTTDLMIANGELDVVSDTVPRLTGHPAMPLATYLAVHPDSYPASLPGCTLWHHLADPSDRETARLLTTLGGVEPLCRFRPSQ